MSTNLYLIIKAVRFSSSTTFSPGGGTPSRSRASTRSGAPARSQGSGLRGKKSIASGYTGSIVESDTNEKWARPSITVLCVVVSCTITLAMILCARRLNSRCPASVHHANAGYGLLCVDLGRRERSREERKNFCNFVRAVFPSLCGSL
jgi:hypothetical protein